MSNFAEHPDLTLNERLVWRLAKGKEHAYKYIVQKAPTARARCRKCSQLIQKGELRVGIPIRHCAGDNGWISAWQHLSCTRIQEEGDYDYDMHGFSAMKKEEQDAVKEEVTSSEVPEHLKPLDPDDLVRRGKLEPMATPQALLRPLLAYQKEGMGWMVRQETESDIKGGILADEMGMGKTIQTIAIMLSHRVTGPTLVVCPVSSMLQWEAEIKEHVVPGSLSVVVVYRTTKVSKEDLESADVVLTTYPMIEQAWRGLINEIKVPCPYCNLLFIPRQLVVHNKYFCGPRAKKTQKQAKREKNTASAAGKSHKVQSAETIRKGLRTLHVDLEDEEAILAEEAKGGNAAGASSAAGAKQPQKKGRRGATDGAEDDTAADTNAGEPAIKREKVEPARGTVGTSMSAAAAAVKKETGAGGEDQQADEKKDVKPHAAARGIMGPMGMYEELMREAGRTVRSRWEAVWRDSDSDSNGSNESSAEEEEDSSDASSASASYDSAAAEAEEKEAAARASEALAAFRCPACEFQLLRYPFCPKTGQHHIVPEEMRDMIEKDTGGDDVDLSASIFHSIKWARVILDEAHRIKGRTTSTARSAFALSAEYRWCLTGTPLQNRVGDLYSLLRFLRMRPYAHYYCETEGCSCTSLSHPFSSTSLHQCVFCGHGPLQHHSYFNRYILNPINRYGYIGDGRRGMMMLSNDVFAKAMLRRTKVERAADLKLPSMTVEVRHVDLTKEERNFYESLYKKSTAEFDTFVNKGTVLHNYAHIFQLLSRLRQALDNPLLVMQGMSVGKVVNVKGMCGVCGEGIEGESALKVHPCHHQFHRLCLGQFLESAPDKEFHCPTCFVRINVDLRQLRQELEEDEDGSAETSVGGGGGGVMAAALPPELQEEQDVDADEGEDGEEEAPTRKRGNGAKKGNAASAADDDDDERTLASQFLDSKKGRSKVKGPTKKEQQSILSRLDPQKPLHGTKLHAIANYIEQVPKEEKVIVFSQFGSMLDLTQYWLQRRFIKAVKLCGSLTLSQRQSVLQAFLHDPSVRVILISLKAGGEGLNLQVANHVVLTDPWWNPAVEMQAVQRAHRIGQTLPVHAVRFVTSHSVEERMVDLQDKKMLVFEGTIDGKMQSLNKLSEEDLQFLFTR